MKTISYKDLYEPLPVVIQIDDDDEEGIAEILEVLNDDARITQNLERKERYHTAVHLEGLVYEGREYAADVDIEAGHITEVEECRIYKWLRENLTEVQYRRFRLFMNGTPIREIARQESANYSSVNESIKATQKKLQKICMHTPAEVPIKSPYGENE